MQEHGVQNLPHLRGQSRARGLCKEAAQADLQRGGKITNRNLRFFQTGKQKFKHHPNPVHRKKHVAVLT